MDESITAYDHLKIAGEEASNALKDYHHFEYADRINRLLDALHMVVHEYIEYKNKLNARRTS